MSIGRAWFDERFAGVYDKVDREDGVDMGTIKQIAERTGYSLSTVSIVLRGSAKERSIPESTQRVILDAARALDYQPNISARRLRSDEPLKKSIAIFWATDYRAVLVAKFLRGAQRAIMENALDAELIVRPYQPERLFEAATRRTLSMYSGAIICTAAKNDLSYMENLSATCPVVLYNRVSETYTSVGVDNEGVGAKAAQTFLEHGCKRAIAVADHAQMEYARARLSGFCAAMERAGVPAQIVRAEDNTVAQGIASVDEFRLTQEHTGVFSCSDTLALGILRRLADEKRDVPGQVEVIAVGTNEADLYLYPRPSLTVIEIPIEEMAYGCVCALDDIWAKRAHGIVRTEVPFVLRAGESTL
jgi:DNA-binding LacI/PurR family transcriptional regulator